MNGGIYICSKNDQHRLGHFSSEQSGRIACLHCDGWMMLEDQPEQGEYKKPNIIWVGIAHVIWFLIKPLYYWLEKHTSRYDDDH